MKTLLIISFACLFLGTAKAETNTEFRSSDIQPHFLELFSSEGCSSCPPADAWLASLRNRPDLWRQFIPVEFHVDYWNRLGWTDRFSKSQFTERQQAYAREWANSNVYTPGFVLDGKEWRPSSEANGLNSPRATRAGVLSAKKTGKNRFYVTYTPASKLSTVRVFGALLGNGLESKVSSGENAGSLLRHEFVVLSLMQSKMDRETGRFTAVVELSPPATDRAKSHSFAIWVSDGQSQKPIQAVGGDL